MRNAETVLNIIHERGQQGLPLDDLYRQLYNPALYLAAYGKLYPNKGAMTKGITPETVDAMSVDKITTIIDLLRNERYRWTPVRRVYIEKPNSTKKRPLGIPTWSDKLLQEVLRQILEAYYEPQFSQHSHGFRPERGCHTALAKIARTWKGTVWFIEGDISGCFDNIDHQVLMSILRENIQDQRFLRLIENLLKAGYLQDWKLNVTHSGTPQGGVLSPLLANIYLDRLDQFVERDLFPSYNQGDRRAPNKTYEALKDQVSRARIIGDNESVKALRAEMQRMPSSDTNDPDYRRLRYIRYADDFLLGFAGPKEEAETVKRKIGEFLAETLHLQLSEAKTLVTHGRTDPAHFLGYNIIVQHNDTKRPPKKEDRRRTINGVIGLHVPPDKIQKKSARYYENGRIQARYELVANSDYDIISRQQAEFRGLAEYYRVAVDRSRKLNKLKWVMEQSLLATLALKHKMTLVHTMAKYRKVIQTERGQRVVYQVSIEREGKKPLVTTWGGLDLRRQPFGPINDAIPVLPIGRQEIVTRLLADKCELCGSPLNIEVHHIRKMADLQRGKTQPVPLWVEAMASRQRKTLVVCAARHDDIHAGRYDGKRLG